MSLLLVTLALLSAPGPKDVLQPYGPEGLTKSKPRRLALLIGIESFEDPRFTTLRYAQDDALALGARLSKEGFDEVRVLTHPDETSRAAIVAALRRLVKQIRSSDDLVFVYVSSHGSLGHAPGGPIQRFLVAKDTRLDVLYETGISVPWLIESVEGLPSERTTIVLATCHSGIGKSVVPDALTERLSRLKAGPALDLTEVSRAMVVLSASAFGEAARESDVLGHDVYTHFFLEALDAADRDADGTVTVTEAHDYARSRTYGFTEGQQRPTAVSRILGSDPMVLAGARTRTPLPVIYSYAPSADGLHVEVDGQDKGRLPGGLALTPGTHTLTLRRGAGGDPLWSGNVDLAAGSRTELSRLLPEPAHWSLGVEGISAGLLNSTARNLFPATFGARAHVRYENLQPGWVFGLSIGGATGSGDTTYRNLTVPQNVSWLDVQLNVGWRAAFLSRTFEAEAGGYGGVRWAWRRLDLDNVTFTETLRGHPFGLYGELGWLFAKPWTALVRIEAGALWARLGEASWHPALSGTFGIRRAF